MDIPLFHPIPHLFHLPNLCHLREISLTEKEKLFHLLNLRHLCEISLTEKDNLFHLPNLFHLREVPLIIRETEICINLFKSVKSAVLRNYFTQHSLSLRRRIYMRLYTIPPLAVPLLR